MKRQRTFWRGVFLAFTCVLLAGCSGDKEESGGNPDGKFTITSNDMDCSGTGQRIPVPFEGEIYKLDVTSTSGVTWTVAVENVSPSDFLTVTPTGSQHNTGSITITAKKNPNREEGHTGTVLITNSINKVVIRFIFEQKEKELRIPDGLDFITHQEFFHPDNSRNYSFEHMIEGPNTAVLWEKSFGKDPRTAAPRFFDPEKVLQQAELCYNFMIDEAGFADRTKSHANKYKLLVFALDDANGTAVGFGKPNVGVVRVSCDRLKALNKYGIAGVLHHEICHSFQYITHFDGSPNYGWSGPIYEMTSQWSLLKKFPDWADLEPGHLQGFVEHSFRAFMHKDNQYHSPYVLEYWEMKHEKMVCRIWKEAIENDQKDPVATYKRLTNISQATFNDEMFDAACRFVSWDIPRIKNAYAKYIDTHTYKVELASGTTYRISKDHCPQNYGYNCIKLKVPAANTTVQIAFNGRTSLEGYNVQNMAEKGWRCGFVAMKTNGERMYGEVLKANSGNLSFTVPADTRYLWFVVMGAPATHWKYDQNKEDNQWPYEFTLSGTTLAEPTAFPK